MATDKTSNKNQQIFSHYRPLPSPSRKRRSIFFISIIIILISSPYPLDLKFANNQIQKTPMNLNINQALKLSIHPKRSKILAFPQTEIEQTFPVLALLEVDNLEPAYRRPIDLVCIVDSSANMTESKIEFVRNTMRYLLTFLGDSDRLSIIFSDIQVPNSVTFTNMTTENKEEIIFVLSKMNFKGETDLSGGIKHTLSFLDARETINKITGVLFISDEIENQRNSDAICGIKLSSQDLEHNAICLKDIKSFKEINEMKRIQKLTNGDVFFLDKLENIDEVFAFVKSLEILKNSIIENVEFFIKRPEHGGSDLLRDFQIHKYDLDCSPEDSDLFTTCHNYIPRIRRNHIFELTIPALPEELPYSPMEIAVASVEAVLSLPDGSQVIKKADLKLTFVKDEAELEKEKVLKQFYKAGVELKTEAKRLDDSRRASWRDLRLWIVQNGYEKNP